MWLLFSCSGFYFLGRSGHCKNVPANQDLRGWLSFWLLQFVHKVVLTGPEWKKLSLHSRWGGTTQREWDDSTWIKWPPASSAEKGKIKQLYCSSSGHSSVINMAPWRGLKVCFCQSFGSPLGFMLLSPWQPDSAKRQWRAPKQTGETNRRGENSAWISSHLCPPPYCFYHILVRSWHTMNIYLALFQAGREGK